MVHTVHRSRSLLHHRLKTTSTEQGMVRAVVWVVLCCDKAQYQARILVRHRTRTDKRSRKQQVMTRRRPWGQQNQTTRRVHQGRWVASSLLRNSINLSSERGRRPAALRCKTMVLYRGQKVTVCAVWQDRRQGGRPRSSRRQTGIRVLQCMVRNCLRVQLLPVRTATINRLSGPTALTPSFLT